MDKKKGNGRRAGLPQSDGLLGANSQIANQLRAFYTSIQEEKIPDRFLELLEKLDQAEMQNESRNRKKASNE
ncbi:MAG: Hypothetical protein BHV28_15260 [Candidatus Tokpelaia hoelldobleri]|uniref:Anti-sigma factor NepR domain-containing protein n=1 Tax=Candidatus Tokpelaia hoelldobleri TaxID=1902579 RepID=A0A1U9JWH7_9HYPH|nr:MAG: Hypothetical protein BHV28_15260 [Candidatus Tokpelaia hoelldoblerii]